MLIEPLRLVVSNARSEYLGLPGPRGQIEALQLLDDSRDTRCTFELRRFRDVLPGNEKTHQLLSRNRLDGSAKP